MYKYIKAPDIIDMLAFRSFPYIWRLDFCDQGIKWKSISCIEGLSITFLGFVANTLVYLYNFQVWRMTCIEGFGHGSI